MIIWQNIKSKNRKQKRVLTDTLERFYVKFLEEFHYKIGYVLFCKLKLFWVVKHVVTHDYAKFMLILSFKFHALFKVLISYVQETFWQNLKPIQRSQQTFQEFENKNYLWTKNGKNVFFKSILIEYIILLHLQIISYRAIVDITFFGKIHMVIYIIFFDIYFSFMK